MHLSATVWVILIAVATIGVAVALAFFDIDIAEPPPLLRFILAVFWMYMACLAFRDVIVEKPLSVDALFGFTFSVGGVIYSVWPRKEEDEIRREIEDEVRRQIREQIEEIRNAVKGKE